MTTALSRLKRLVREELGCDVASMSTPYGQATGTVVRIRADGRDLIGKIHRNTTLHNREVHAYREWTPRLGDATPVLLAVDPELPGIVITAVPGQPLDTLILDRETEREAYRQAGEVLAQLHSIAVPDPADRLTGHLQQRGEYWISEAEDNIDAADAELIRSQLRELRHIDTPRTAPCHLDFQPRNLLWHDNKLRLIDFENSRPDLAARDLVRLATRVWPARPDLKTAFLEGYGPLQSTDAEVLTRSLALEAITSVTYGYRTRDDSLIHHGTALLQKLRKGDRGRAL